MERAGEWGRGEEGGGDRYRATRRTQRGRESLEEGEALREDGEWGEHGGLQASTPDPAYLKWKRKRHPRDSRELGRVRAAGRGRGSGLGGGKQEPPGLRAGGLREDSSGEADRAQPTCAGGAGCRCEREARGYPALHPDLGGLLGEGGLLGSPAAPARGT